MYWDRRVRLTVGINSTPNEAFIYGAEKNCNHRIDFNIRKTRDKTKNTGTISIYNLSKQERNAIDNEYDRVLLNLGYQGETPFEQEGGFWSDIVDGWVHKVSHRQDGVDTISTITYIEAAPEMNRRVITKTFDSGTKWSSVVRSILSLSMEHISIGDISGISESSLVPTRGFNATGKSIDIIEGIAKNHDARVTIDNNTIEIVSNDSFISDGLSVPVFNSETGLLSGSTKTEKGVIIRTLLHPHIRPNRLIVVQDDILGEGAVKSIPSSSKEKTEKENIAKYQEGIGGVYRVNQVVFSGSNRSSSFNCDIEGQLTDGYKVKRPEIDRNPQATVLRTKNIVNT